MTKYNPYQPDNVPLFEAIYGDGLISLGGLIAIDNMFSDLNIVGLKALDLGFGLGGAAYYLAEKYKMTITGVEVHPWMAQYANDKKPLALSNQLEFTTYDEARKLPFQSATFDLVYSKGVLNHVGDKLSLFNQVNDVLKPDGLFVIADWIFPESYTENTAALVSETKTSYEQVLQEAGFNEISFRDDSESFFLYVKELLNNLAYHHDFIKLNYGEKLLLAIQKQHEELMEKINSQQKIAVRIVAKKIS